MSTPELLPCPFCGEEGEIARVTGGSWAVSCSAGLACYAPHPQAPGWHDRQDAISAWNHRVPSPDLKAARATIQRLNRRAQAAESELAKERRTPKGVNTWASRERQQEARERDAQMAAIETAANRITPQEGS